MKKIIPQIAGSMLFLAFLGCSSNDKIDIPEGEYTLSEKRDILSLECGMSETTFGNTIVISDGQIETHPLKGAETVRYTIKKTDGGDYLTKVHRPMLGDTVTIEFDYDAANKQVCFLCSGEKIIYQK